MPRSSIYVVDDDDAVRDSLITLLEAKGYDAVGFESPSLFLATLPQLSFGCLIVDLKMPGMSGLELMAQLAALNVQLPIIMITAFGDVPTAVRAMREGATDFVVKPFTDDAIIESINLATGASALIADVSQEREAAAERIRSLSRREREVMEGIVAGDPNKVIAYNLGLSTRTVEIHRARVMEKMQVRSLSSLVRLALSAGVAPNG